MRQVVGVTAAMQTGRHFANAYGNFRTEFIGRKTAEVGDEPEAFLIEMPAGNTILPHFHQVDQYQVFVEGCGLLGRNSISPICLHYVDRHTAYGPIDSGRLGLSFFTIRARSDPGGLYLHVPEQKRLIKPSKKRYLTADSIGCSTAVALRERSEVSLEGIFSNEDEADGLGARMLRMGPHMKAAAIRRESAGDQFVLVLGGCLEFEGAAYHRWSVIHSACDKSGLELNSGKDGLEALILNFPRAD